MANFLPFLCLSILLLIRPFAQAREVVPYEPTHKVTARPQGYQCEIVNWMEMQQTIKNMNDIIAWASDTPIMKTIREKFKEKTFVFEDAMPKTAKILGTTYQVKSSIINLHFPDIQEVQLTPTRALSATKLNFGIECEETLQVNINFGIAYSKERFVLPGVGWSLCPWEWQFWGECPETSIEMETTMEITNLHSTMDVEFEVYTCSGGFFDKVACSFTSTWNFVVALFQGAFRDELMKRVGSAEVTKAKIKFDSSMIETHAKQVKNYAGQDPKEFLFHAEMKIQEWLTKGKAKGLFFKAVNWFSKTAINKGLVSFTDKFKGICYRR